MASGKDMNFLETDFDPVLPSESMNLTLDLILIIPSLNTEMRACDNVLILSLRKILKKGINFAWRRFVRSFSGAITNLLVLAIA